MAISVSGGSSGGGGGSIDVTGNGFVVHNNGLFSTTPLIGVAPVQIDSPEGLDGAPLFRVEAPNYPLGKLLYGDLTSTALVVPITMATAYIIRRIVFTGTTQTPTGITATVSTQPGGAGVVLANAVDISPLTDRLAVIEVEPTAQRLEAPYLYVTLSSALTLGTMDVLAFGDAMRPMDDVR